MRTSSKILLAFLLLIIMITAISFAYVKSAVEIEPATSINGRVTRNIFPESFTSIDIKRGNWFVEVIRSDSFFVNVQAGDNLVNNYLKISVVDSTLVIDIDSVMIRNEFRYLKATVEMPSMKRLKVDNNSFYRLLDFDETNLDINIKSGRVSLDTCQIENLFINASGDGKLFMSESSIGELSYAVKDSAYIMAEGAEKINCLGIDDLGVFVNSLNRDEIKISTSEKRKKLTNQMTSYVGDLKWLMPLDTVLQIMNRDSLNFKIRDDDKPFLFESLLGVNIVTYYNISGVIPDVENKQLIFSRGLLTNIIVKYFSFCDLKSTYAELEKTFNSQYGSIYKWEQPSEIWDSTSSGYWRAPEQIENNKYTSIQLHYDNYRGLGIFYSSPINSYWRRSRSRYSWRTERLLSELRSFPNIVESFILYFNTPARSSY